MHHGFSRASAREVEVSFDPHRVLWSQMISGDVRSNELVPPTITNFLAGSSRFTTLCTKNVPLRLRSGHCMW